MAEPPHRRRRPILPYAIACLAVLGALLVVLGRLSGPSPIDKPGWQDAFYSVFLAFTLDGSFLGEQSPLAWMGAFCAALALYLAVFGSLWLVFRRHWRAFRAARMKDHIVVVGDGADAEELAIALARQRTNVVLVGDASVSGRRLLGIARPPATSELIAAAAAHEARTVVVMLADERVNAAIATSMARERAGARQPAIWCRIGDRLVADRVAAVESGVQRIVVFDEAQMMARDMFARHPAHALAERMAADRVHLLVVGFGRLGQAAAEEGVFSGIVAGLERPMVTVIDRDANRTGAIYRENRPALDKAADFAFIEAGLMDAENAPALPRAALAAVEARDEIARVTAIVICLGSDADNVRLALALPDIRRREGRYAAPAFMRLRDPDAESVVFASDATNVVDPQAGVLPLERPTRLLASDILDSANRDAAARRLHEAYTAGPGKSTGASADWNHLPETYRRANRRSADHIAAKLFSVGYTSEHDAHEPVLVERQTHRAMLALLADDADPRLGRLAAIEHRRWSADRVIDGWSWAPLRDDDRKQHPLLERADHETLPLVEQRKDRDQIRTVLSSVVPADGRGAMPEIRVALAGHRNLAAAEESRALAMLSTGLVARLARPEQAVTLVSPLAPGADMAMTEALAAALKGKVGQLRLLVPEAVPYRTVLEFIAAETGDDPMEAVAAMLARRQALFARFDRVDVVRIGRSGISDYAYRRDAQQYEDGLMRANAYIARRCDMLAALWDGAPARGHGGTGELVAWWRDPEAIAAGIDPGPSPVRVAPVDREAALLIVPVQRPAA